MNKTLEETQKELEETKAQLDKVHKTMLVLVQHQERSMLRESKSTIGATKIGDLPPITETQINEDPLMVFQHPEATMRGNLSQVTGRIIGNIFGKVNDIVFEQDNINYVSQETPGNKSFSLLLKPEKLKIKEISSLIVTVNVDFKNSVTTYTEQIPIEVNIARLAPRYDVYEVKTIADNLFQIKRALFMSNDGSEYRITFGLLGDGQENNQISLSASTEKSKVIFHSRRILKI
jgi:hypothetical protein